MQLRNKRIGLAVVRGRSMLPTYQDGDRVVALYGSRPRAGHPHLVQLPPSPDGPRPLAIKRIAHRTAGGWWISSDNPDEGTDSRVFGPLPTSAIIARVVGRPLPGRPRQRRSE